MTNNKYILLEFPSVNEWIKKPSEGPETSRYKIFYVHTR